VEDNSPGRNARRRKSAPNDQQRMLSVDSTALIGRSSSFKMPKSTADRLSPPNSAEGAVSKSLPTTPVELAEMQSTEQAGPSTTAAGGTQPAKTAWTKVKDIVTPARRGSADVPSVSLEPGVVDGRSSSAEPCRVPAVNDDEADPWIEKRPRSNQGRDDRAGRSSVSPPRISERPQGRKRFSVSHSASVSAAKATLSTSPLDLAGLLGMCQPTTLPVSYH